MAINNHTEDNNEKIKETPRTSSGRGSEKSRKAKCSGVRVSESEPKTDTRSRKHVKEKSGIEKVRKRISEPSLTLAEIVVPELSRACSRNSLPYPSFNRAYSKESICARKNDIKSSSKTVPLTPTTSDLSSKSKPNLQTTSKDERPPSPPETDVAQEKKSNSRRMSLVNEVVEKKEEEEERISLENCIDTSSSKEVAQSRLSIGSKTSMSSTNDKSKSNISVRETTTVLHSITGSMEPSSTAIKEAQTQSGARPTKRSPSGNHNLPPKSSSLSGQADSSQESNLTSSSSLDFEAVKTSSDKNKSSKSHTQSKANTPVDMPRIDYLLQNGGLLRHIPRKIISSSPIISPQSFTNLPINVEQIFGPCLSLLEQYETVLKKNGSVAVATGYRSVARRLLDRLEVVMGRSLSSEGCSCLLCQHSDLAPEVKPKTIGWGEVLEWSSGRKELPTWPAFDFSALGVKVTGKAKISKLSHQDPTKNCPSINLDPDIADDFREYYIQESKKTRITVDTWLSKYPPAAATPPQEVDDETISFAILTHLHKKERPIFNALLTGSSNSKVSKQVSSAHRNAQLQFISQTGVSIQRLYRLSEIPRHPEVAIFLLRHPELHNLLAAITEINNSEWEILISGRFDGFLWSGADPDFISLPNVPHRESSSSNGTLPSRSESPRISHSGYVHANISPNSNVTSVDISRSGSTKISSFRKPVLNDEENELAVLIEVEREIHSSMETLEDAFETLHKKAETIRRALRERQAGLNFSLQCRRLSKSAIADFSSCAPTASGLGMGYERPNGYGINDTLSDSGWDPGDELHELVPDDSASNVSYSRKRCPKFKNEMRVPELIEEDCKE